MMIISLQNIAFYFKGLQRFFVYFCTLIIGSTNALSEPESATNERANELELLEQSIAVNETSFADLVPEAKKKIRWFNGAKVKTDISIIYFHGFSASRQEISPVTERIADKLGANAFYTRLTGHGRSGDAMAEATVEAWKQDAREAFKIAQEIGNKVIVVSTSTGATLATWAAAQEFSSAMVANIMVSPNFGIASRSGEIVRWPLGLKFAKLVSGDYRSFEPRSESHRLFWTERYPMEALVPMVKLVDEVAELDKSTITVPQLLIYSPKDTVINVDKVVSTAKEFTNSDTVLSAFTTSQDQGQHVLAGDACSPASNDSMISLIHNYLVKQLIN